MIEQFPVWKALISSSLLEKKLKILKWHFKISYLVTDALVAQITTIQVCSNLLFCWQASGMQFLYTIDSILLNTWNAVSFQQEIDSAQL